MTHRVLWSNIAVLATDQITNTTAETTFGSQVPFPANLDFLGNAGRAYRLKGFLALSTAVSGQGTIAFRVKWGVANLAASAAIALPASLAGAAGAGGMFEVIVRICTTGASGKIACQGFGFLNAAGTLTGFDFVNAGTLATGQITVNTQTAANLGVSAQFSVASASNIVTLTDLVVEELT